MERRCANCGKVIIFKNICLWTMVFSICKDCMRVGPVDFLIMLSRIRQEQNKPETFIDRWINYIDKKIFK